jgi:predicted  nucleic acid-binding Zn-ribbon protein
LRENIDDREYSQLDSLASSNNTEISRLSLIIRNLKDRLESLEKNQTELMEKIKELERADETEDDNND